MEGEMVGAVADAPEVEGSAEPIESQETPAEPQEEPEYGPKSAREYSQWIKGGMNPSDPNAQRFQRMTKDNFSRMYTLNQLEPGGIDGVREKYALLDSVTHGELKGAEAVSALQDTLREVSDLDERVVNGDFGVFESFGPEMQAGILKMVPNFLESLQKSDPAAYGSALLPHFVNALRESPMISSFNALVDALNEPPPQGMPAEAQKWFEQRRWESVRQHLGAMSEWLNAQDKQAKALEKAVPRGTEGKPQNPQQSLDSERQQFHYEKNITPQTNKYAENRFNELLRPYQSRLKLNDQAKAALASDFVSAVTKKANANPVYKSQMARFYGSRTPDPKQVVNLFKVEFDKYAQSAMKSLVEARYGNFLNGKGQQQAPAAKPGAPAAKGPVGPKEYVTNSRPQSKDINHQHPKYMELYAQGKFPMMDGRIAIYRR